jgi:acyl-coenzyme A thioesterase PaaI-like protein
MAIIAIHNEDWGFETNCFVCEPKNSLGLRIPFFHDTDADVVFAQFALGRDFSGAPTLVHGGVSLAVLDEAMAWACIAVGHRWAMTAETTTRFNGAVYIDKEHRVEARVAEMNGSTMTTAGSISDLKGRVRAEATATFTVLGEAQAQRIAGVELDASHTTYTHPPD